MVWCILLIIIIIFLYAILDTGKKQDIIVNKIAKSFKLV